MCYCVTYGYHSGRIIPYLSGKSSPTLSLRPAMKNTFINACLLLAPTPPLRSDDIAAGRLPGGIFPGFPGDIFYNADMIMTTRSHSR